MLVEILSFIRALFIVAALIIIGTAALVGLIAILFIGFKTLGFFVVPVMLIFGIILCFIAETLDKLNGQVFEEKGQKAHRRALRSVP